VSLAANVIMGKLSITHMQHTGMASGQCPDFTRKDQ